VRPEPSGKLSVMSAQPDPSGQDKEERLLTLAAENL
jgi:hypothetical protein